MLTCLSKERSKARRGKERGSRLSRFKAQRSRHMAIVNKIKNLAKMRCCVTCRKAGARHEMVRLTVDHCSNEVCFNSEDEASKAKLNGRSAYLCRSQKCLEEAFKGTRLKFALQGRKGKGPGASRSIKWPLEPQLIKLIAKKCTEP